MRGITRIAGRLLWANPGRLIVLVAGAVSVALASSGVLLAASTSLVIVRQTVDTGWRGTYDILVRPADAPSLVVTGRDLVPLDYLGLRTSGITREQLQHIVQLSNVAIAAPVAALGWLKSDSPNVSLELVNPQSGVVYQIEVVATIAGQQAIHATGLFASAPAGQAPLMLGLGDVVGAGGTVEIGLADLPATWGLVVGVDPAAEDRLMGLHGYVEGIYLSTGTSEVFDEAFGRNAVAVPVLTAKHSSIPGDLTVTVSTVDDLTPDQVTAALKANPPQTQAALDAAIARFVDQGSSRRLTANSAQLVNLLHPLRQGAIILGPDGRLSWTTDEVSGSVVDNNVVLIPNLAGYGPATAAGADLVLRPLGSWESLIDPGLQAARPPNWSPPEATFGGDSIVYRDLEVAAPPAFQLVPLGTYDREAIDSYFGSAANDAPLGVYSASPRTLISDANGRPVNEPLPGSINPAGLNPLPPIGLTNLEAVEALRGDHFIDAIRVRVSGVTGYTPDAVRRIEAVAQQIVETTGLHVDVVAGSSPVDLRVAVPGVGTMSERWTTLGTAAQVVSGAEGLSAALLAGALGVVVAYLAAFGTFLTGDQLVEIGILRRVGWRRRSVVTLVATQAVALGLLAASLTVVLVVALAAAANLAIGGGTVVAAAVAVLAVHPVAAGLAGAVQLGRRQSLRSGQVLRPAVTRGGIVGLAIAFAGEAPGRAVMAAVAAALALMVAGLVATVEVAAGGELRTTLFGQAVAVRLAPYHLLAAAAALFAAGALILDGALLTVERRLSLIGTLRAIGWRSGAIRRLVTLETALPAVIAGVVAAAVVGVVAWAMHLGWGALLLALGMLVLAIMLAALATQLPTGVALRAAPAATLRAEGASGVIGAFAPRQAVLTVTALVLTVSLVAGGWGVAESAASAPLPFVPPTEHPLSPAATRIQGDVAAITSSPDRVPGSSNFDRALGYVGDALKGAGYAVRMAAYLSRTPEFLDQQGEAVDQPLFVLSLAYDSSSWDGRAIDLPATLVDATGGRLPSTCPRDITVFRIDGDAQVLSVAALQQRCLGHTVAVISVRAIDEAAWVAFAHTVARVRLPVGHFLTASSHVATEASGAPWLVAAIDSMGQGATQSAAAAAVILDIARQAAAEGVPLRVGVVAARDGAAGSVLIERMVGESAVSVVWLGAMGGSVPPVLGTAEVPPFDRESATASLLAITPVDTEFAGWLARASHPSDRPTSDALLAALADRTGLPSGAEASWNASALGVGLDAAFVGEPGTPRVGPPSVAGTRADTVAQIHPSDLESLAIGILGVIRELHR